MSTVTIRRTFKVNGVLTDVTSAKLSDATGAYGVKRNDTDAVVVADGTDMTRTATGTYEYTFTEPASDLSYTAWVEFVYQGRTYRAEHDVSGTTAAEAAADDTIAEAISTNAKGPARVSVDGTTVEQHPLRDQIEADKYVNAQTAAEKNHMGLRFFKMTPPEAG